MTPPPPINVRISADTDATLRALAERYPVLTRHRLAAVALELGARMLAADPMRAFGASTPVDLVPPPPSSSRSSSRSTEASTPAAPSSEVAPPPAADRCPDCGEGVPSKCANGCGASVRVCLCPTAIDSVCPTCAARPPAARPKPALALPGLAVAPRKVDRTAAVRAAVLAWQSAGSPDKRGNPRSNVALGAAIGRKEGSIRAFLRGGGLLGDGIEQVARYVAANGGGEILAEHGVEVDG